MPGTRRPENRAAMDRNGNFDYRNLFYPGPAPLPVQIYPVSGDPRFPFHFPPSAPNITTARRESTSHPLGEDMTADEAAQPEPTTSTVAKRNAAASPAAGGQPSAVAPPVKLDHVVQGLSHLLNEAISFCEDCLKTHKELTAAASFAGHATLNSLWRELLDSRLEASGVHKDLLSTLAPRVRRYTQQAQQAVAAARGADEDEHDRLALMADKLAAQCNWVGQLSRKALGSSVACESLVETMRETVVLCGKIGPCGGGEAAAHDGHEGGGGQY